MQTDTATEKMEPIITAIPPVSKQFNTPLAFRELPLTFMGLRDSNAVYQDYIYNVTDTDSLRWPWEPAVFYMTYNDTAHQFEYTEKENTCIDSSLVNGQDGSPFTIISLYPVCQSNGAPRSWAGPTHNTKSSKYGICPAISTNIATYNVTSLFAIAPSVSNTYNNSDSITSTGNKIKDRDICPITSLADGVVSQNGTIDISELYGIPNKDGGIDWVSLDNEDYFKKTKYHDKEGHKDYGKYELADGIKLDKDDCIKSKVNLEANVGPHANQVSISTDTCASDDIAGFLDQKLVSFDDTQDTANNDPENMILGVNFVNSLRYGPCMGDIPADQIGDPDYHVMTGYVELDKELFNNVGGKVAVDSCGSSDDPDTPAYLSEKLKPNDRNPDEYIPVSFEIIKEPIPCASTDDGEDVPQMNVMLAGINRAELKGLYGNGKVSIGNCNYGNNDDEPGYLNEKLRSLDGSADYIPVTLQEREVSSSCTADGKTRALHAGVASTKVLQNLNLGALSSIFTTDKVTTSSININLKEQAGLKYGALTRTSQGWELIDNPGANIDIEELAGKGLSYNKSDGKLDVSNPVEDAAGNGLLFNAGELSVNTGTGVYINSSGKLCATSTSPHPPIEAGSGIDITQTTQNGITVYKITNTQKDLVIKAGTGIKLTTNSDGSITINSTSSYSAGTGISISSSGTISVNVSAIISTIASQLLSKYAESCE